MWEREDESGELLSLLRPLSEFQSNKKKERVKEKEGKTNTYFKEEAKG